MVEIAETTAIQRSSDCVFRSPVLLAGWQLRGISNGEREQRHLGVIAGVTIDFVGGKENFQELFGKEEYIPRIGKEKDGSQK
ncbi:hypothetical protein AVEN_53412-1 [Araneus ventricosus]|uniref:Uncharacterized protein n=1 Tax=Araneus ventricosus TaxID=182803 RepID=A0A4Y2AA32_ARAVE|nr:hypothetical protein AVEN_53412-1 [Araneus ventricosus]